MRPDLSPRPSLLIALSLLVLAVHAGLLLVWLKYASVEPVIRRPEMRLEFLASAPVSVQATAKRQPPLRRLRSSCGQRRPRICRPERLPWRRFKFRRPRPCRLRQLRKHQRRQQHQQRHHWRPNHQRPRRPQSLVCRQQHATQMLITRRLI